MEVYDKKMIKVANKLAKLTVHGKFRTESKYGKWQTISYKSYFNTKLNRICSDILIYDRSYLASNIKESCRDLLKSWDDSNTIIAANIIYKELNLRNK